MTPLVDIAHAATAASVAASAATATVSAAATSAPGTGTIESIVTSVVPSVVASILPSGMTTTTPVAAAPIFLPMSFEIAAVFAGALSGALTAVNRRFDAVGVVVLAFVNGLGGGIIRDVLIQKHGIFALQSSRALLAALAAALLATFFYSLGERMRPALVLIDTLSLGLFTLVGADRALVAGLGPVPAILLGTITAVGGGMIRDVLLDREPQVLHRGSLYASAAVVGSAIYVAGAAWLNVTKPIAMGVAALVAISLRLGSLWLGWESPEPVDLTASLLGALKRLWLHGRRLFGRPEAAPAYGAAESDD